MSQRLEAAREYLWMGLHPIPCAPRSKRPLVEWRPYQIDPPLADEIETWWSEWPDANVALVLGRGTFAVDLDGGQAAEQLLADRGITLPPEAPRSKTANGYHVFLSAPGSVPDRVGLLTSGGKKPQVDIRGVGIVVAPPSIHPDGPTYEWQVPLSLPLPEAPENLLALIYAGGERERPKGGMGANWVAEGLRGVGLGERDDLCARLAGYFLGQGLDAGTVEAILCEGFARNCTPPFDPVDVRKTVRSINRKEAMSGGRERKGLKAVHISAVMDEMEAAHKAGPPKVTRTPFGHLNAYLGGGFAPGELIYLGAKPGVGKSSLALQMAYAVARDGEAVLILSREMTNTMLGDRMVSQVSKVPALDIRNRVLTDLQKGEVKATMQKLRGEPIWFTDDTVSVGELVDMVTGWSERQLGLVIVDYLQLVRAPNDIRDRRLQVEAVSQALKTLALTCLVPVLCLSSVSRSLKDKREKPPTLEDLRESGELEHDADIIFMLHRILNTPATELNIAKNRNGPVGRTALTFHEDSVWFEEKSS